MKNISRTIKGSVLTAAVAAAMAITTGATSHVSVDQMVGGLSCEGVAGFTYAAGIMAGFSGGTNVAADVAAAAGGLYLLFAC